MTAKRGETENEQQLQRSILGVFYPLDAKYPSINSSNSGNKMLAITEVMSEVR